jgi:hypothetical protein
MPSVWVVEVEDRFEGLRRFGEGPLVTDVDALVGVVGEELKARATKGLITASEYRLSASSPTTIAASGWASSTSRMAALETGTGLPRSSTRVHDSMPRRR